MLIGTQTFPRESMERLSKILPWGKQVPESRLLLPPRENDAWDQILPSTSDPQRREAEEPSSSSSCWPFFKWILPRSFRRRSSTWCNKDPGPGSKVHPLSSRMIRKRNTLPPQRAGGTGLGTALSQRERLFSSSWGSLNCRKNSPLQESHNDDPSSTNNNLQESKKRSWITTSKWGLGLGLSVPDMWPVNSCKMGSQMQNLKSIITTPSSWRWFHSSNSMLKDFLEDMEILKNMDTKDLNEYRELLLDEPLTFDRLQHYPKLVLRVFVFLLRNQEPPRNLKKKVLIELCTRWRCKNKNYFCLLENEVNTILQSEHMMNHLPGNMLSRLRSSRPMRRLSTRGRNEDGNLDAYALGGFAASSVYKDIIRPSTSETTKIKLHDVSRFEEQEQLVSGDEKEDFGSWGLNDDGEGSGIGGHDIDTRAHCPCFLCSSDDLFCHGCTCTLCKDTGEWRDAIFWVTCKDCAHMTHLQCAVKAGYVGCTPDRRLDGEYWCQSCGAKHDMVPNWKSWLREASQCDDIHQLKLLVYCAMLVLKDTQRPKYKDLQVLICEAWEQLMNGGKIEDIRSLMGLVCADFDSIHDDHLNPGDGVSLENHATVCFQKAEEDILGVNETIQEVEAWKTILSQTEEQLKRLELKLELKTKSALLSRAAAMIATKRLHEINEDTAPLQQEPSSPLT